MRKSTGVLLAIVLLTFSLAAVAAESCRYSAPRDATLDAAGLASLAIELGPNNLTLHGVQGATTVTVRGTACASNPKALDALKLEATRAGTTASVTAVAPKLDDHFFMRFGQHLVGGYAYLKLDVAVPATLAVKLAQGSGDANARGIAALSATLGSGDLDVQHVAGQLALTVGSGDVVASDVGSLDLVNLGSGDVSVERVHGAAAVGAVGSGDLTLTAVTGGVQLQSLASGDVKLTSIARGVTVDSVGSGDLVIRDVTGNVSVGALASGDVSIHKASGNVHAGSVGSGDFGAVDVGGDFSVDALGSGDVSHRGVKGDTRVPRQD